MTLTWGHLFVPVTNPLWGPHSWFVNGDWSGDLSLGRRIGDEEVLMGGVLGRLWMVFLRKSGGVTYCRVVFTGETLFQTVSLFMLYIIYWTVGVSLHHVSDHLERYPRSSIPWTDTYVVEVLTTWRPLSHTEDNVRTYCTSFRHGSTEQLIWCLIHMRVGGMGIRMLTIDTKTSLYSEVRGLQVPMVLEHDYIPHTCKCFFRSYDLLDWPTLIFEWQSCESSTVYEELIPQASVYLM